MARFVVAKGQNTPEQRHLGTAGRVLLHWRGGYVGLNGAIRGRPTRFRYRLGSIRVEAYRCRRKHRAQYCLSSRLTRGGRHGWNESRHLE